MQGILLQHMSPYVVWLQEAAQILHPNDDAVIQPRMLVKSSDQYFHLT